MTFYITAYMPTAPHVTFRVVANDRNHALRLARWDPRSKGAVRFSAVRI